MFRLDINALRFLAVISVVLFHFKVPYTSGGYSGVDIFFVISGYLMHHMLSKNTLNRENVIIFYKKRFSRIFPALALCLFIFSIASTVLSPLSLLNSLTNQVLSAATFTSNLFFTNALSSYFSQTADSYIFLHTWSLGLEFQYYLIFPLILLTIRKLKFNESLALAFIAGLSLVFCLIVVNNNQTVAFYNLPFRAWELLVGAYASSIGDVVKLKPKTKKAVELFCIFGILAYVIFGGSPSSWPDEKAIIPTLLTFIILVLKIDNDDITLKNTIFQGIGKWSYSIYLYHWPLASILVTHNLENNKFLVLSFLVISIVLGYISYRFIENDKYIPKKAIAILALAAVLTPIFGKYLYMHEKWLGKNDLLLDSYSKYDIKPQFNGGLKNSAKSCFLSSKNPSINDYDYSYCTNTEKHKKTILLFGDSHVAEFSKAIREKYWNYNIIQATSSGCPPIINVKGEGTCQTLFKMIFNKIIKDKQIDIAIVGANWSAFSATNDVITGINQTNQLLKERIPTVKFISQTKNYSTSLPILIMNSKNINNISPTEDSHAFYKQMKKDLPTIDFIDIYDYGCKKDKCKLLNDDNIPMFFDNNHYTYEWTKNIVNDLF